MKGSRGGSAICARQRSRWVLFTLVFPSAPPTFPDIPNTYRDIAPEEVHLLPRYCVYTLTFVERYRGK